MPRFVSFAVLFVSLLGQDAVLGKPQFSKVDEQYKFFGAHSVAVNRAQEATAPVTSRWSQKRAVRARHVRSGQ